MTTEGTKSKCGREDSLSNADFMTTNINNRLLIILTFAISIPPFFTLKDGDWAILVYATGGLVFSIVLLLSLSPKPSILSVVFGTLILTVSGFFIWFAIAPVAYLRPENVLLMLYLFLLGPKPGWSVYYAIGIKIRLEGSNNQDSLAGCIFGHVFSTGRYVDCVRTV